MFGLNQENLAFRAGIDRTYVSQIERAIASLSLAIICFNADKLGSESSYLPISETT